MNIRQLTMVYLLTSLLFLSVRSSLANTFVLPPDDVDLVGQVQETRVRQDETLADVALRSKIGQNEIVLANQAVDRWMPEANISIVLPTRYILPGSPRTGIVLNLPELRLYRYWTNQHNKLNLVSTYPVSIGRLDWQTPLGESRIISRINDPAWTPPESIKIEAAASGRPLADVIPAGPNNPLGQHALRLDIPGYLLHGTNRPIGIGMRVTHGCIRLYPEDIETLYRAQPVGTGVLIINQPVKVGWHAGLLYLEVHPPLEEDQVSDAKLMEVAVQLITDELDHTSHLIRSSLVRQAIRNKTGTPVLLSRSDVLW